MTTVPRRLRALLLFLLFLGGGTSLPSLDAVLFHRDGEPSRSVAHFESSNGCTSHAGHCGIGCPASAAEAIGTQVVTGLVAVDTPAAGPRPATGLAVSHGRQVGFHSRAPPTVHA